MGDGDTAKNTDRVVHIFKEDDGPFAAQGTVFVTAHGGVGFCLGGLCIVKPPQDWHALAAKDLPKPEPE